MKKLRILALIVVLGGLMPLISCNNSDESDDLGNWSRAADFRGVSRSGAVVFTIDDVAYVGLGFNANNDDYVNDFWKFDPEQGFWQEVADFPGTGRISAAAFSAAGKGYVGTGYNADLPSVEREMSDFWEYDPSSDTWTQRDSFPGEPRYNAVAFGLSDLGYIGTGIGDNSYVDFFEYNPGTGTWSEVIGYPTKIESAWSFVMDNKAYVGGGWNNGTFRTEFHAFDGTSKTWEDLSVNSDEDDFDEFLLAVQRHSASALVIDDMAYIVGGVGGISSSYTSSVVAFDPATGTKGKWDDAFTSFEGSPRGDAVSFILDGQGYYGTGGNNSRSFDDVWQFFPLEEFDEYD